MKGLLLKDWYMVMKYCKAYLLICLVFIGVSIMSDDNFFFILYPCILCGMIPVTLLGYDERSKWDQYCAALPYTKAQIVSGKYLLGMGTQIGMLLLSAVIQVIRMRVSGAFSWKSFSSILSMLAILSFLTPAISLPPMFRWGVEKGRMAYYISVGLVCGIRCQCLRHHLVGLSSQQCCNAPAGVGFLGGLWDFLVSIHPVLPKKRRLTLLFLNKAGNVHSRLFLCKLSFPTGPSYLPWTFFHQRRTFLLTFASERARTIAVVTKQKKRGEV